MRKFGIVALIVFMMLSLGLVGCSTEKEAGEENQEKIVRITHKNYTEQRITGQLLAQYIEATTDYKTQVTELGGTMLCFEALKNDQVDLYAEFTGSAYGAILEQTEILGVQETYDYVKQATEEKFGITWLEPLGWNNTYVLSVRAETAEELGLKTISDLIPHAPEMVIGSDNEFIARTDGIKGLKEAYGITFKEERPMDQGLTYAALRDGQLDINSSFSTDGRIAKFNLYNLEDDKNFFPPYYVTPILKMEFAENNPELVTALLELGGMWTEAELQAYNLRADEGEDIKEVAAAMLRDKGLIE